MRFERFYPKRGLESPGKLSLNFLNSFFQGDGAVERGKLNLPPEAATFRLSDLELVIELFVSYLTLHDAFPPV